MNSKQIFEVIQAIGLTSSKNEKVAIVASHKDDKEFKRVLIAALDPLVSYGMKIRPDAIAYNHDRIVFDDNTWEIISKLASRQLTGGNAVYAVGSELGRLNADSAELFWRIISKDLKADFSDSTVNKAIKGLIQEFPYMRCSLPKDAKLDEWNWPDGVVSQEKADGMFSNINHYINGDVLITSRQGTPFPMDKFQNVVNDIKKLPLNRQFHGEFLVMVNGSVAERSISNGIMNSVLKGGDFEPNQYPVLLLWDSINLDSVKPKGKYIVPYVDRLSELSQSINLAPASFLSVGVIPNRIVYSLTEAYQHCQELMLQGKEGTIIKKKGAIWTDSTSKEQVKLKLEFDIDLEVYEIAPGRVGSRTEGRSGALRCKSSCGNLLVDVAIKNEKMRNDVDADPSAWLKSIVTVTANEILSPSASNDKYSLFLPRLTSDEYRTDKSTADSLERIKAAKEMAILGQKILEMPVDLNKPYTAGAW